MGQILQIWLSVFGMPFVVLSLFMFLAANDLNGKHRHFANFHDLKIGALSFTTPYDELRIPHKLFSFGESFVTPWGDTCLNGCMLLELSPLEAKERL